MRASGLEVPDGVSSSRPKAQILPAPSIDWLGDRPPTGKESSESGPKSSDFQIPKFKFTEFKLLKWPGALDSAPDLSADPPVHLRRSTQMGGGFI